MKTSNTGKSRWIRSWRVYWCLGAAYLLGILAYAKPLRGLPDDIKWVITLVLIILPPAVGPRLKRRYAKSFRPDGGGQDAEREHQSESHKGGDARAEPPKPPDAGEKSTDGTIFSPRTTLALIGVVAVVFSLAVLWGDDEMTRLQLFQLLISIVMLSVIFIAVVQLTYARQQLGEARQQSSKIRGLDNRLEKLGKDLIRAIDEVTQSITTPDRAIKDASTHTDQDASRRSSQENASLSGLLSWTKPLFWVVVGAVVTLILQFTGVITNLADRIGG